MTAPPLTIKRNPFQTPDDAKARLETVAEKGAAKMPAITPSAAGLVLSGTIIGPDRRVARIGGKTYTLGQIIDVVKPKEKDGEGATISFQLIDIQPRRAILEADGNRYELTIPEPEKSDKIEFELK